MCCKNILFKKPIAKITATQSFFFKLWLTIKSTPSLELNRKDHVIHTKIDESKKNFASDNIYYF